MTSEFQKIRSLFAGLIREPRRSFPAKHERFNETDKRGVYIIEHRGKVLHVGGTPRGQLGIRQRLKNHLHGQSSFTINSKYLKKHAGQTLKARSAFVRNHCRYRCLVIEDERQRVLLEAYAIGHLCPDHIGLHQVVA